MAELKRFAALVLLGLAAVSTGGCAVGNTYAYRDAVANVAASGTKAVAVATHDQREFVVSGKKTPDFVGLQRGGWGNPFDVNTKGGTPLSDDMTTAMAASLAKKGFKAIPVLVPFSDSADAVLQKLKQAGADALLLLTLTAWKTDTYTDVMLGYDVVLKALGKDGAPVGEKRLQGTDNLGGSAWNPGAHASKAAPEAFGKKMEELLNAPEIAPALQ
jgi:hypothetical protein